SVWVAANAGSGKTRVLTDRVTRLLLDGAEPARILCLTFTKAAAAEMAGRLFARLGAWSLMDDAALGDQVAAIAGEAATADPERLAAARRLFAKALDTPGGLKIQTIHGFCEGLLRRFPIEAGLSARFHVLDEGDAAAMRDRALDTAILSAEIPALFRETLALALDERTLREQIAGVLERRGGFVEALAKGKVAGLIADLEETFGVSMQDTEDAVCAAFFRAAPLASFEPILAALRQSGVQDAERADQAAPALFAENDVDAFAALRPLYVTKEGAPRKKIASAKLRKAAPQAADRLEAAAEPYLAATERLAAIGAFRHSAALNAFAAATLEAYETEKRAAGALDYEDLILSTRRLFADPEAAAWALYKLDGGLDHILVDEAQDTSPEQWEVVLSPLREFFAGEGAERPPTDAAGRPPMPRTVFAVGDEKQSIYSFQGADVAKFSQMQGVLTAMTTSAGADWRVEDLSLSFRSAPPVLAFVDAVFGDPAAAHGVVSNMGAEGGDAPLRHSAFRNGAGGRVEFWPAAEPEPQTDARAWDAPVDQEDDANPKRVLAARIADT
ncbi:MAG: UvrD-helicase domain-containing protein, partial [Pseudomonadota bacterium]